MIVRTQTVRFTPDRAPTPRKVKIGFEGDNMVERLCFKLPRIAENQTATMMLDGEYANMVILTEDEDRYYVDLTAELIGGDGEHEAYIVIDGGDTGEAWGSGTFALQVGEIPGFAGDIAERFPDAIEQLRGEIAGHRAEMQETSEEVKAEADAARAAVLAAENQAGQAGAHSKTAEAAASDAQEAKAAAQKSAEYAETLHGAVENGVQNAFAASDYANFAANNAAQMSASAEIAAMRAEKAAQKTEDALSGGDDGQVLGKVNGEPTWIDLPEVGGGDVTTDALDAAIARHNASGGAHPDIRAAIDAIGGGTGGAVASVNGKTGAVVLTAADVGALAEDELQGAVNDALAQAKESGEFDGAQGADGSSGIHVGSDEPQGDQNVWIDPEGEAWQMPTASETVKGGVKVGEGLQMDGDVLGVVPEGEWELIETVKIEEEELKKITRTTFPDGSPYSLSAIKVMVKIYYPIPNQIGTNCGIKSGTKLLASLVQTAAKNTNTTTIHAHSMVYQAKPNAGLYEFIGANGNQGGNMAMSYPVNNTGQTETTNQKITGFDFAVWGSETITIPIGTTIQIWGVRA